MKETTKTFIIIGIGCIISIIIVLWGTSCANAEAAGTQDLPMVVSSKVERVTPYSIIGVYKVTVDDKEYIVTETGSIIKHR